jgi:hypothetical protein
MKQQKKPVKKTGNDEGWCVDKDGNLSTTGYVELLVGDVNLNGKRPNRIRCKVCKQRFEDKYGLGSKIPKHKVQKKKRK